MPSQRLSLSTGFPPVVRPPYVLAAGLVALGWLAILDMLDTAIFSSEAGSLGPGMAVVSGVLLKVKGIPLELWQSLCVTDVEPDFSWASWSQFGAMGAIMTLAMMLPCASPAWRMLRTGGVASAAFGFLGGYGFIWILFSLVLATVDMSLHLHVGPHLVSTAGLTGVLAAAAVIGAGVFQWTGFKHGARLQIATCNLPDIHGDARLTSSFPAGIRYAGYCVRSNGLLMMCMVFLGMMNIVAMALLLLAMALEKSATKTHVSHGIGIALVLAGSLWMYGAVAN
ncbi:DUF2182 domain-containing protein [Ciceribacter sp. L1K23]|uniref:copper chaperone n=1 Tax=Ciceribacter sp. L1K23 TaxID=2820276 RepID=UPI001B8257DD|nr:DUF2182 domain-containing protein [Ciceribacter sp. L1K23]MBR0555459.1 DUF2182 domain-containing protein [Ciceribacter sp. L1K23]